MDLGTGAAHFLVACQSFGHHCLGSDVEVPVYADVAADIGVERLIQRIEAWKPCRIAACTCGVQDKTWELPLASLAQVMPRDPEAGGLRGGDQRGVDFATARWPSVRGALGT